MNTLDLLYSVIEESSRAVNEKISEQKPILEDTTEHLCRAGKIFAEEQERLFKEQESRVKAHLARGMRRTHADPV